MALEWQTLHLPLAAGVNQKADARALQPPALAIAHDLQLEEHGGIQTRKPYVALGSNVAGGGAITTARRLVQYGTEWCLFTKDSLYSWDVRSSRWVRRGTHLAIAPAERSVFTTTGDQIDGDRAELGSMVVFAWTEADVAYVAIQDRDTGGVFLAPTAIGGTGTRPRLVALATKILLLWHAGTDAAPGALLTLAIDPAGTDPATIATQITTPSSTTVLAAASFGSFYDVVQVAATDTAIVGMRRAVTTSYELAKVTAAVGVTTSTKARTCDGPIAVAADPTGAVVQVIRADGTNIVGDRITFSSLADAATAQAIGDVTTIPATPTNQIAACYRSVQNSGAYRCYVFWSAAEIADGTATFAAKYNFVDTAGTIGSQTVLLKQHGIVSRAFDHDGSVYVHVAFAGSAVTGAVEGLRAQLQNTYFLYRDDALLCGKQAMHRAGGFAASTGRLPAVQGLGSGRFAWCGTERRVIPVGDEHLDYSDRGPREITFTFDDNRARRTVQAGGTLYIAGAEVMQYDGTELTEVGFHTFPWKHSLALAATGAVEDGVYSYKATWRTDNKRGERDRSTTATVQQITMTGGPRKITVAVIQGLQATHKTGIACEVWRTAKNPTADSPFYLVTSQDPNTLTNPNRYLPVPAPGSVSSVATLNDEFADSTATTKESNPENEGVLESLAPPPAVVVAAHGSRVFLGGVPGDRRVWYSKQRNDGEVASFHDALVFDLPVAGGDLIAIAFTPDGILIAFCETAIYAVPGDGFDNLGQGSNYGPPRALSVDVGCRDHDSVAVTPLGIVFQSGKGKYLLDRGLSLRPIGLQVVDYDDETVLACHVDEALHQVRWLTGARMLVWDYLAPGAEGAIGQWFEWTISNGVHAAVWNGVHHYLSSAGPLAQQTTYTGTAYGIHLETAWIKPADLQGAVQIRKLKILGEYRSACHVRVRILYDYVNTVVDEKVWAPTPTTVGGPLEVEIMPSRQQCQAIKIRITVEGAATQADLETDGGGTELSAKVDLLPASDWNATLTATPLGDLGNAVTLSMAFVTSTTAAVKINNHYSWNLSTSRWERDLNNLGVLVTGNNTTATVEIADVEAAINEWSSLLQVSSAHPTPSATIDFDQMGGVETTGTLIDGAFAAATGEAIKLTGISLELGYQRGLFKRLPPAQRA